MRWPCVPNSTATRLAPAVDAINSVNPSAAFVAAFAHSCATTITARGWRCQPCWPVSCCKLLLPGRKRTSLEWWRLHQLIRTLEGTTTMRQAPRDRRRAWWLLRVRPVESDGTR